MAPITTTCARAEALMWAGVGAGRQLVVLLEGSLLRLSSRVRRHARKPRRRSCHRQRRSRQDQTSGRAPRAHRLPSQARLGRQPDSLLSHVGPTQPSLPLHDDDLLELGADTEGVLARYRPGDAGSGAAMPVLRPGSLPVRSARRAGPKALRGRVLGGCGGRNQPNRKPRAGWDSGNATPSSLGSFDAVSLANRSAIFSTRSTSNARVENEGREAGLDTTKLPRQFGGDLGRCDRAVGVQREGPYAPSACRRATARPGRRRPAETRAGRKVITHSRRQGHGRQPQGRRRGPREPCSTRR